MPDLPLQEQPEDDSALDAPVGRVSVKFNGREVTSPVLRLLLGVVTGLAGMLGILAGCVAIILIAALVPLTVPVHLVLRVIGRRGFFLWDDGAFSYVIDGDAFRKQAGRSREA